MVSTSDLPPALRPYAYHGVAFDGGSGANSYADCPFCGRAGKFSVHRENGQFACGSSVERCGRIGNAVTFLAAWHAECLGGTTAADLRRLSKLRGGMPASAFRRWAWAWDSTNGRWVCPAYSLRKTVADLRTWREGSKRVMATAGCKTSLFGLDQLIGPVDGRPVYVCEGEWDAAALCWLLDMVKVEGVVVAVPGAKAWKDDWSVALRGRNVVLMYDADGDGDRGSAKAGRALARVARSVKYLCWPEDLPTGYDVRDYVTGRMIEAGWQPRRTWRGLAAMVQVGHRRPDLTALGPGGPGPNRGQRGAERRPEGAAEGREGVRPARPAVSWPEVVAAWRERVDLTRDLEDSLAVVYGTVLSQQIDSDPVWLFLCGAPGSGKSLVVNSLIGVPDVVFQSTLTAKSLVSGWRERDGSDASLLPRLGGKVLVAKDWTEVLDDHDQARRELYKTLRGAYDGSVARHFGNNVDVDWRGQFSIVAAVTNKIHGFSTATSGERFLKFQLPSLRKAATADRMEAALCGVGRQGRALVELEELAVKFLDRGLGPVGRMAAPEFYGAETKRLGALAELVAVLRHEVEWERRGHESLLKYRPSPEVPTRLIKQLAKLGMGVGAVLGVRRADARVMRLVERVAFDTAIGFGTDVVEAVAGRGEAGALVEDVVENTRLPYQNARAKLIDLSVAGLVSSRRGEAEGRGRPAARWELTPRARRLWTAVRPAESHVEAAVEARVGGRRIERLMVRRKKRRR